MTTGLKPSDFASNSCPFIDWVRAQKDEKARPAELTRDSRDKLDVSHGFTTLAVSASVSALFRLFPMVFHSKAETTQWLTRASVDMMSEDALLTACCTEYEAGLEYQESDIQYASVRSSTRFYHALTLSDAGLHIFAFDEQIFYAVGGMSGPLGTDTKRALQAVIVLLLEGKCRDVFGPDLRAEITRESKNTRRLFRTRLHALSDRGETGSG